MSLEALAARAGMDRFALSRPETGRYRNPTVGTLTRVAAVLGLANPPAA